MYGNDNRRGFNQRNPPVAIGDELDVRIDAVGEKGDGLTKKDGFVLIVPGAKENDEVRIKVTRVLRQVGFAEVIGKAQGPISDERPQQRFREKIREARPAKPKEEEFTYDESKDSENFGDDEPNQDLDAENTKDSENMQDSSESEQVNEENSKEEPDKNKKND